MDREHRDLHITGLEVSATACRDFADSKTLSDEKREQLFGGIEAAEDIGFAVDRVTAADISSQMLRRFII